MGAAFILDIRLAVDSAPVLTLPLCDVRLMNDARFPWLIMVPQRMGKTDLFDLDPDDRRLLIEEIALVSRGLKTATDCHKINVAALGNMVRQLHVHVVARSLDDAAWPQPVWGVDKAVAYRPQERNCMVEAIRAALPG
jgi:diadenosine tetraphosphate (Ap4A) HIT family hydrolase